MNIEELADLIEVDLVIRRYAGQNGRHTASFDRVEIIDGRLLRSDCGNGSSPRKAINDYIEKIRNKRIVINAMLENRKEFRVPKNLGISYDT